MFREMRRKNQHLDQSEIARILTTASSGVLALLGDDGYPYAVPMSYAYNDGKLYFHCAKSGHKLDAIRNCTRASFCVVDMDHVVAAEYTTYFRSVIAFGQIRVLEDEDEMRKSIQYLAEKYGPGDPEQDRKAIEREFSILCMFEMTIDHVTGKEGRELANQRRQRSE